MPPHQLFAELDAHNFFCHGSAAAISLTGSLALHQPWMDVGLVKCSDFRRLVPFISPFEADDGPPCGAGMQVHHATSIVRGVPRASATRSGGLRLVIDRAWAPAGAVKSCRTSPCVRQPPKP